MLKTGSLLLAEPFMGDSNFKRAAVLITDYRADGVVGFVINKPKKLFFNDLALDVPPFDAPVFSGGPVSTDRLYYIHSVGDLIEGSTLVSQGIWFGGDFEQIKFLITNQLIEGHQIRFYVGYTGWDNQQLKEELQDKSWIELEMDPNYLFNTKPDRVWQLALNNKSNVLGVIGDMPDANLDN
jgi:putative transcriptional regulator